MPRKPEPTRIVPPYEETVSGDNHSLLINLDADDHPQYHNDARALTWLGTITGSVIQAFDQALQDISGLTPTTGDLLRWDGLNWVNYPDSNFATSGHNHDHSTLTTLAWASGGHTGTANYVAGFDAFGNAIDYDPSTLGLTDHTLLSNLAWTSSGHTGTASNLAGFDGAGNPTVYAPSSLSGVDHTSLTNLAWTASGHTATANTIAHFNPIGDPHADTMLTWDGITLQASAVSDPKLALVETGSSGLEIYDATASAGVIRKLTASGNSNLYIESVPEDGTSTATISMFLFSPTTIDTQLYIYSGAGSINHRFRGAGNTRIAQNSGNVGIGSGTLTGALLDVFGELTADNLLMSEAAAGPSTIAGEGSIWVKNSIPTTLWYTDDTGTSYQLAYTSGSGVDHSGLTNLAWTSSGHTGTASTIAGFSGAGAAAEYVIGTDIQAYDPALNSIAGLTTTANTMIYTIAADAYQTTTLSAFGRSLIDDADAAAARVTLGNVIAGLVEDTSPQLGGNLDANGNAITYDLNTLTSATNVTIDWNSGNKATITMAHNVTFAFTDPTSGACSLQLIMKQDGIGSRAPSFPVGVKWPGGTVPTWSTGPNEIDIVSLLWDGTTYYATGGIGFA